MRHLDYQSKRAIIILTNLLGSANPLTILITVLFIVSLGWFTDISLDYIDKSLSGHFITVLQWTGFDVYVADFKNNLCTIISCDLIPKKLVLWSIFPILLIILVFYARYYPKSLRVSIEPEHQPAKAKALILYLSPANTKPIENLLQQSQCRHKLETIDMDVAFPRHSWRMPLESIVYHLERLQYVIIIPPDKETIKFVSCFKDLLTYLLPVDKQNIQVKACHELGAGFPESVNSEDIKALAEATQQAYDFLLKQKVRKRDILIDITGGKKTAGIAGAIIALEDGREFQYVSTDDYQPHTFDVTYDKNN